MTIGYEVEIYLPTGADYMIVYRELSRKNPELYNPQREMPGFKYGNDYSIGPTKRRSLEFRSHVCNDVEEAIKYLRALMADIEQIGARPTSTCGFHVHCSVPEGIDWKDGLIATLLYWIPVQKQFMKIAYGKDWVTNRAYISRARFCYLWTSDDIIPTAQYYSRGQDGVRFRTFNPFSIIRHGTVEYRLWPMVMNVSQLETYLLASYFHAMAIDWKAVHASKMRETIEKEVADYLKRWEEHRKKIKQEILRRWNMLEERRRQGLA